MNNHSEKQLNIGMNNNKFINSNIIHKIKVEIKRRQNVSNDVFTNQPGDPNFQIVPATLIRNLSSTSSDSTTEKKQKKTNNNIKKKNNNNDNHVGFYH
jgi:hypothetical protein